MKRKKTKMENFSISTETRNCGGNGPGWELLPDSSSPPFPSSFLPLLSPPSPPPNLAGMPVSRAGQGHRSGRWCASFWDTPPKGVISLPSDPNVTPGGNMLATELQKCSWRAWIQQLVTAQEQRSTNTNATRSPCQSHSLHLGCLLVHIPVYKAARCPLQLYLSGTAKISFN